MHRFAVAPASAWKLADAVPLARRDLLLHGRSYPRTVLEMLLSCTALSVRIEAGPGAAGARCVVTAQVDARRLDRFFSSSCGYRAQYLMSPHDAHHADRFAIECALPMVLKSLRPGRRAPDPRLVEASLQHPWATVWPQHGPWLQRARREDRILQVPAWQQAMSSASAQRRLLARRGALAPAAEPRLQLTGGFVREGEPLLVGRPPAHRALEIHELGFTQAVR